MIMFNFALTGLQDLFVASAQGSALCWPTTAFQAAALINSQRDCIVQLWAGERSRRGVSHRKQSGNPYTTAEVFSNVTWVWSAAFSGRGLNRPIWSCLISPLQGFGSYCRVSTGLSPVLTNDRPFRPWLETMISHDMWSAIEHKDLLFKPWKGFVRQRRVKPCADVDRVPEAL